jgi:hypothetical protein
VSDQAARQERHTEPITIALDHLLAQDRFEQPYVRAANVALDALLAERDALAEALLGVAPALQWLAEHHPKAIREMPHGLYESFARADEALLAASPSSDGAA